MGRARRCRSPNRRGSVFRPADARSQPYFMAEQALEADADQSCPWNLRDGGPLDVCRCGSREPRAVALAGPAIPQQENEADRRATLSQIPVALERRDRNLQGGRRFAFVQAGEESQLNDLAGAGIDLFESRALRRAPRNPPRGRRRRHGRRRAKCGRSPRSAFSRFARAWSTRRWRISRNGPEEVSPVLPVRR